MNLAIIGYGKMGKTIHKLAEAAGHRVELVIDLNNQQDLSEQNLAAIDAAIEFTRPESAYGNIMTCLKAGTPIVSGTTGWLDRMPEIQTFTQQQGGAFFYASNFSVGVNIFFAVNRFLAQLMNDQPQYQVFMEEIHHTFKLDAPSGTAITLANDIIERLDRKTGWVNDESSEQEELSIISKRQDPAPGTHEVQYRSAIDTITIQHEAHSREGFARGAIAAAEWVQNRKGVFSMQDMLGF